METQDIKRSGFVGILGPTNSGKSTLLNRLVGHKLSIVSKKVQTTYHGIKGVREIGDAQVVFVDTPGFQRNRERIARLLNRVAQQQLDGSEINLWVFDLGYGDAFTQIETLADKIRKVKTAEHPDWQICILNKVDKFPKGELLPLIAKIHALDLFADIIPISAKDGTNVERIERLVAERLPEGGRLFPEGYWTDRSAEFLFSEFIREKIYESTHQEVPYSVQVEIENNLQEALEMKIPVIHAAIHVDAPSRKVILVGKGGEMVKRISTHARKEIEAYLGRQVCLKLFVHVEKDWIEDDNRLQKYLEL